MVVAMNEKLDKYFKGVVAYGNILSSVIFIIIKFLLAKVLFTTNIYVRLFIHTVSSMQSLVYCSTAKFVSLFHIQIPLGCYI